LTRGVVIVTVALTLVLVVAAGLFVQTFERLARVPLGFNPDGTLVVSVTASTVPDSERPTLVSRLAKAVSVVPGVKAAGGGLNPPIIGEIGGADLVIAAPGSLAAPDASRISHMDVITPGWFASYGISIEAGRDFDDRDLEGPPTVMIVNAAFVRRLFPGQNVIGMPLAVAWRINRGDVPFGLRTIVGVADDSVYRTPREPVQPMIFVPLASRDPLQQKDFYIGVRATSGSPLLLEHQVASAMTSVSADVAFSIEPLTQQTSASLTDNRAIAMLSAFFGVLALVLAAVGLYGVIAYGVAQRRSELGVRIALGAKRGSIVTTMLGHVMTPVGIGVAAGVGLSVWAATLVRSLLYGLEPRDPVTLTGAVAVLATVATIAGWLPAYRASRLDPAKVLRES
jgi:predicted permease